MSFGKAAPTPLQPQRMPEPGTKTHRRLSGPPWKLASRSLLLFKHGPTERSQATATQLPTYAPRPCCQSPALRSAGAPGQLRSATNRGASVAGRPGVSDHLKAACTRHPLGAGSCRTLETPNLPEPEAGCFGLRHGASQCRVKDTRWEARAWISGPAKGRLTSIPPASTTKPIPTPNASNVE